MTATRRLHRLSISFAAVAALAACGGGGGGEPPPPPPPPPPVGSVTLTGVVARGAALPGASVVVTCATGTGTATTTGAGAYSLAISGGALPCVLKATSSDGTLKLHSVAPAGTATSVTANVTPLTELVVARLSGADPATFVAGISASTLSSAVTASAVASAQASVASTLAAGGVNTSTAGDFISGALVAATPGSTGNAYDQVLDALNARITAAGTTLAALTTTIASGSPAASPSPSPAVASSEPSLPADLLLKPKAANCAALASTTYRLVKMAPSPGTTVTALDTVDIDAPSLTLRLPGTQTVVSTWTANGNCRYTAPDGADIVVSPAGVIVARATIGLDDTSVAVSARGTTRMILGLPAQDAPVDALAGTWNYIGWERQGSATVYAETAVTVTVASSGAITEARCGSSSITASACPVSTTLLPVFSVNSAGGFNLTSTDPNDPFTDRVFGYRAGNGSQMSVYLSASGSIAFTTRVRTLSLPAAGAVSAFWNIDLNEAGLAPNPLSFNTHTVASVDTAAGSLVRNTAFNGSTVTMPQTLQYNAARSGYIYRPGATVTNSANVAATYREGYFLPLGGFGLTVYSLPARTGAGAQPAAFGLSVSKQP